MIKCFNNVTTHSKLRREAECLNGMNHLLLCDTGHFHGVSKDHSSLEFFVEGCEDRDDTFLTVKMEAPGDGLADKHSMSS